MVFEHFMSLMATLSLGETTDKATLFLHMQKRESFNKPSAYL